MTATTPLPKLITFDGEARSGKGTIVSRVKDTLRDEYGYKVMLIDAGQVFRCLVVAATNRDVDLDDPHAIDAFLSDDESAEACVQFVKAVYHMEKVDRDALLYSPEISVNSAKIGARPLSQAFKDTLLRKWLRDARSEGFDIVLLDGRALEEVGMELEAEGLCEYNTGLYFTCEPKIGAMRTLGYADVTYADLTAEQASQVDMLAGQIDERNRADTERAVQPIRPPFEAYRFTLPNVDIDSIDPTRRVMAILDTSQPMSKDDMTDPVLALVKTALGN